MRDPCLAIYDLTPRGDHWSTEPEPHTMIAWGDLGCSQADLWDYLSDKGGMRLKRFMLAPIFAGKAYAGCGRTYGTKRRDTLTCLAFLRSFVPYHTLTLPAFGFLVVVCNRSKVSREFSYHLMVETIQDVPPGATAAPRWVPRGH